MKIPEELRDKLVGLTEAMIDDKGYELLNPNPMVVDVVLPRLSLHDQIRRILRNEISMSAYKQGLETAQEFDDFDVPDEEPLPLSGFEFEEMAYEVVDKQPAVEPDEPVVKDAGEPAAEPEASPSLDVD